MLPKISDVVIIGGGGDGASVAYHLACRVSQCDFVEREEQFGQGSTGSSGGICHHFSTEVTFASPAKVSR
jgi:glycine/D-amino acid oxidase-like deaminating enzyme